MELLEKNKKVISQTSDADTRSANISEFQERIQRIEEANDLLQTASSKEEINEIPRGTISLGVKSSRSMRSRSRWRETWDTAEVYSFERYKLKPRPVFDGVQAPLVGDGYLF